MEEQVIPAPTVELTEEQKADKARQLENIKKEQAKVQEARKELKRLWDLWQYLISKQGTRLERRQFVRDFIKDGKVMAKVVVDTIRYQEETLAKLEAMKVNVESK